MDELYIKKIASLLSVKQWQVENCISMLEEGSTVPFISRYRKERTGALDEVQVAEIKYHYGRFSDLESRKQSVLKSLGENPAVGADLLEKLSAEIAGITEMQELEDLYLPYRPKRKTKAVIAAERGLAPLAEAILGFRCDPEREAARYVTGDVADTEAALEGARHIIAEKVAETPQVRAYLRDSYMKYGDIVSAVVKARQDEASNFENYFDHREKAGRMAPHRVLAVLRGMDEGFLSVKVDVDRDRNLEGIVRVFNGGRRLPDSGCGRQVAEAAEDAYRRLLHPSIENEVLKAVKQRADMESIKVFGENLRQLLLAPPVGQKRTLAIDPGFRTGCKVVCLDAQGNLLHNDTIYPHPPQNERIAAMKKISNMVEAYRIEVIAIGNGTASRETENFIRKVALPQGVKVYSVSEDGASVYSASPVAREEFPDYDVTVRGAVSIGRRLMDPLAELVKIDPKSLGIGQYQHDVDQNLLKEKLDETVVFAVNSVGVNLNTASMHLLSYVSGIGPATARNIVEYRAEHGAFSSRSELLNVKRLGAKAFEQAAGFLRVPGAVNPLDNSAVHPEKYAFVERLASDLGLDVSGLVANEKVLASVDPSRYADEGEYTVRDILAELAKPGRDPRSSVKVFEFSSEISTIDDLRNGMRLPGIVTNITGFGAFVDIGIKENGLIHVSNMADGFVSDPTRYVKLHEHVEVEVLSVDTARRRIQLKLVRDKSSVKS